MGAQVFTPLLMVGDGVARRLRLLERSPFLGGIKTRRLRLFEPRGDRGADPRCRESTLASVWLACRRGGELHDASFCLDCPRFVGRRFGNGYLEIRCHWNGDERVEAIMTDATALVCVPSGAPCEQALDVCRDKGVRNVVVVDGSLVRGIANDFDLMFGARDGLPVSAVLRRDVPTVAPETTLTQAITAFADWSDELLFVIEDDRLLGVVSPGDLLGCGADPDLFVHEACTCCGAWLDVHEHPDMPAVMMCADCLASSFARVEYEELGAGD